VSTTGAGNSTVSATNYALVAGGWVFLNSITLPTGTLQLDDIRFYINDSGENGNDDYVGLYNDNAGKPGTLVVSSQSTSYTPGGWNTASLGEVYLTVGSDKTYWLAITPADPNPTSPGESSSGTLYTYEMNNTTDVPLPTNFSTAITSVIDTGTMNILLDYCGP
jgi:hypothetical protein